MVHLKMATFNVVICQKEPENRPEIEEEGLYLCLVVYKIGKDNTVMLFRRRKREYITLHYFVIQFDLRAQSL